MFVLLFNFGNYIKVRACFSKLAMPPILRARAGKYKNHLETSVWYPAAVAAGTPSNAVAVHASYLDAPQYEHLSAANFSEAQASLWDVPTRQVDEVTSVVSVVWPQKQWRDWPLFHALRCFAKERDVEEIEYKEFDGLSSSHMDCGKSVSVILRTVFGEAGPNVLRVFGSGNVRIRVDFRSPLSRSSINNINDEDVDDHPVEVRRKLGLLEEGTSGSDIRKFKLAMHGPSHDVRDCHADFYNLPKGFGGRLDDDADGNDVINLAEGFVNVAGERGRMAATGMCQRRGGAAAGVVPQELYHASPAVGEYLWKYGEFVRFAVAVPRNEENIALIAEHFSDNPEWPLHEMLPDRGTSYKVNKRDYEMVPLSLPDVEFQEGEAAVRIQRFAGAFYD